jgi:hypothetical protein
MQCILANDMMTANYELGRRWKEVVVVYFKIIYQHLPGRDEI